MTPVNNVDDKILTDFSVGFHDEKLKITLDSFFSEPPRATFSLAGLLRSHSF